MSGSGQRLASTLLPVELLEEAAVNSGLERRMMTHQKDMPMPMME